MVAACGSDPDPAAEPAPIGSSSGAGGSSGTSSGASSGAPVLPNECPPGSSAIATDGVGVSGIAADSDFVYWTNERSGTIAKVPRCGGATTVLASGPRGAARIAVDETTVYWTNPEEGTVSFVPKAGGATATLVTGQPRPGPIRVNADFVYWLNWSARVDSETIVRVAKTGGEAQTLTGNIDRSQIWQDLTLDASTVFFTNQGAPGNGAVGGIFTIPLAGGVVTKLAARVGSATAITLDNDNLYVATQSGTVYRVSLASNEPAPLAANINNAGSIAVDQDNVYWTNDFQGRSSLYSIPKNGGGTDEPELVVAGSGRVRGLVVMGKSLYWTFDGATETDAGPSSSVMRRSL